MRGTLCTCGCCSGLDALSPENNAPGQPVLSYRLGTYSIFLERMLSQIASPNTLANPPAGTWNLANLTTRSPDDPTIALLDAWSVVLDVLTFYQERVANEGFLRTATERRSVLELARAIGYELNPGVSAGTYLSFIIEDVIGSPSVAPLPKGSKTPSAPTQGASTYNAGIVTLAAGTQVQSVPPQGQVSQTFETSAELDSRTDWNLMLPRVTRPADFALGSDGNLYLLGSRGGFPMGAPTIILPVNKLYLLNADTPALGAGPEVTVIQVQQVYVSGTNTGIAVGDRLLMVGRNGLSQTQTQTFEVRNVLADHAQSQTRIDFSDAPAAMPFAPVQFPALPVPSSPVPFNRANVESYVLETTIEDSDLQALMKVSGWDAELLTTVANYLPASSVSDQGIFSFSTESAFFGSNAPQWKSLTTPGSVLRGDAFPQSWDAANNGEGTLIWTDSQGNFHQDASVYLERNFAGVLSNSWMLIESPGSQPIPFQVTSAADKTLADYGLTGKSTGLMLQTASRQKVQSPGSPALGISWGILNLYAANSDGSIYFQDGITGNWGGFSQALEGNFSQTPTIINANVGQFDMFVVGNNGSLYHATGDGGLWWNFSEAIQPFPLSVKLTGSPSVVIGAPNQFDVLTTGSDGNLYHFWKFNNQWHGPELHTAPSKVSFVNSPVAVSGGPTTLEVFSIGLDGKLYHTGWTLNTAWWGPLLVENQPSLNPVISYPAKLVGSPAAGTNGLNPVDVFAIGADGNLYHAWYYQNKWNGMENLGGNNLVGSPCLVLHGPSNLEVFAIGADGNLYHKNWIGGSWFGPFNLGGGNLVGSPSATAPTSKTIEVAATGSDGNFYHFWFDGLQWHGPEMVPAGYVPPIHTRKSKAHIVSEQQLLVDLPVTDDVDAGTTTLMLNGLVTGLTPGQAIAVSGNRADAPNQTISEVVLLAGVLHVGGYTQLEFESGLVYSYARSSMTLNANTVAATHGATIAVPEVLGSGSAAQINQSFTPRRSPVTHVPAATATGAESTLQVQVNNLIWQEKASLFGLGPTDRAYITRQNDEGTTTITFGDGITGGLLPTGQNNVTARYRVGLGTPGNLPSGSISVLQSRPPGLRTVNNAVPASGGANAEDLSSARGNAPRTVLTIDRIVSISDYANFAAAFAGIGKAQALTLAMGQTAIIHITVAGVEGAAVDPVSQLALSLSAAIDAARDLLPQVVLGSYQPVLFSITATIVIDETDYEAAKVHAQVVNSVTAFFSFSRRGFAQPVTAAEVVANMQAVPGVVAVELTQLYRNDDPNGPTQTTPSSYLPAHYAQVSNGVILPAELLLLNPAGLSLTDKKQ